MIHSVEPYLAQTVCLTMSKISPRLNNTAVKNTPDFNQLPAPATGVKIIYIVCVSDRAKRIALSFFLPRKEEDGLPTQAHLTHPRGSQVGAEPKKCLKKDTHHSKHPLFCR